MIKTRWVKSNMRSTIMLMELKEVNTMDEKVKKETREDEGCYHKKK